jgi:adenylyltransferase/sulfurtransferase
MSLTKDQLLQQVKKEISEVTPHEVHERLQKGDKLVLVDVREKEEFDEGAIENAVFIPRGFLELRIENAVPDKDTPIVVYCAGGVRSALATKTLKDMGYKNVQSMVGGFNAWKNAQYKVVKPKFLTPEQRARYSRQILIPEVGEKGQIKLLESKVLLIGAGGLGSPAAYYLAAAGVGTLGIVDSDVVDESNLQRQILHNTEWLGKSKVESAQDTLKRLNPGITVIPYAERLSVNNIDIIKDYDVIIDGSDNFKTRYLVNDACVFYGKPNIYGSIFRFEGQATTFIPGKGPCYRCLYPIPTPAELAPT